MAKLGTEKHERLVHSLEFVIDSARHKVKFQQITMDPETAEYLLKLLEENK